MKDGKRFKSSLMDQQPLKKKVVILESPLQVLPLRPRITPLMMCFFIFVVCVVSCTAFTPDSADIADDGVAVVAIVNGTIVSCVCCYCCCL